MLCNFVIIYFKIAQPIFSLNVIKPGFVATKKQVFLFSLRMQMFDRLRNFFDLLCKFLSQIKTYAIHLPKIFHVWLIDIYIWSLFAKLKVLMFNVRNFDQSTKYTFTTYFKGIKCIIGYNLFDLSEILR